MVMILGIFFVMSFHPMFMVGALILISLFYSLGVYLYMGSYWFSYALVMVMLSGVLVVFTYLVSLFPNESFELYGLIYVMIFMMMFLSMGIEMYGCDFSFISVNLWVSYVSFFNLFLVNFLLSVMLMVVWVSSMNEGAVKVM